MRWIIIPAAFILFGAWTAFEEKAGKPCLDAVGPAPKQWVGCSPPYCRCMQVNLLGFDVVCRWTWDC